jgi:hypothetical protein
MCAASISYRTRASTKHGYFQSTAKGQERVVAGESPVQDRTESVIATS